MNVQTTSTDSKTQRSDAPSLGRNSGHVNAVGKASVDSSGCGLRPWLYMLWRVQQVCMQTQGAWKLLSGVCDLTAKIAAPAVFLTTALLIPIKHLLWSQTCEKLYTKLTLRVLYTSVKSPWMFIWDRRCVDVGMVGTLDSFSIMSGAYWFLLDSLLSSRRLLSFTL